MVSAALSVALSLFGCVSGWFHAFSAGLLLKPYHRNLRDLHLLSSNAFPWGKHDKSAQVSQYLAHIRHHTQGAYDEREFSVFNAQSYRDLLTVTGVQTVAAEAANTAIVILFSTVTP